MMGVTFRKSAALLLLVLVSVPVIYMLVIQVKQQIIHNRMKEKLEEQLLQSVVLEEDKINWFQPGKEVVISNRFFDVKNIEDLPGGRVRLTGLFDDEETLLVERMKQTRDEENSNRTEQTLSFFLQLQGLPGDEPTADFTPAAKIIRHQHFNDSGLPSPFRGIVTPPPQA